MRPAFATAVFRLLCAASLHGAAVASPALTAQEAAWATALAPRHVEVLPCATLPPEGQVRVAEADGLLPWVNLRAAACVARSSSDAASTARMRWVREPAFGGLAEVVIEALPLLAPSEGRALATALRTGPHASWAISALARRGVPAEARP